MSSQVVHVWHVIGWSVLGVWAYFFVGFNLTRRLVVEHQGVEGWQMHAFIVALLWPIIDFIELMED